MKQLTEIESRPHNRRLAQWRVTRLTEHSASHQLLWCIESFVLRNPPLRQAPKRYSFFNNLLMTLLFMNLNMN
jgi:hypothetical protein